MIGLSVPTYQGPHELQHLCPQHLSQSRSKAATFLHFLFGEFGQQTPYERWMARMEVGLENDDFTKNMVTVVAEERSALAVKRPEAPSMARSPSLKD
jgi:hypothetical protein